jgi:hypothetical protein
VVKKRSEAALTVTVLRGLGFLMGFVINDAYSAILLGEIITASGMSGIIDDRGGG